MKSIAFAITLALFPSLAFAQMPAPSPTQQALRINSLVGEWATAVEQAQQALPQLQKQIEDLKKKNADLQAELDKAHAKKP